ncbi:MAG: hypothetical protein U0263_08035, partial [Polyangiaceae bacterium]
PVIQSPEQFANAADAEFADGVGGIRAARVGEHVGPYVIETFLGPDGMTQHYRARHRWYRRVDAVTLAWVALSLGSTYTARVKRAASAREAIRHPHLARVHAGGTHGTPRLVWIAGERRAGPTLRTWLLKEGPFAPDVAIRLAAEVASAMHALKGSGHGRFCVTPRDVLVTCGPSARVSEFSAEDFSHYLCGQGLFRENWYGPPEGYPESRSTAFSLGLVLYEMVAGRALFPTAQDAMRFRGWRASRGTAGFGEVGARLDVLLAVDPELRPSVEALAEFLITGRVRAWSSLDDAHGHGSGWTVRCR